MNDAKRGAALLASILLLGLMLVLTLLYTAMVRLEGQIAEWNQAEQRARLGLETALAWALADISGTPENDWHSLGPGGDVAAGLVDESTAGELGWPIRYHGTGHGSLFERAARATWETHGDTNTWHLATAWVGADLTGLLDPLHAPPLPKSFLYTPDLSDPPFLTPGEFTARHPPPTELLFLPHNYSVDRGWYDNGTWKTNVVVNGRTLSPNFAEWDEDDIRAVLQELYPSSNHAELTAALLDFRAGPDTPTQVDSLTAVPIPMFNEVRTDLTLSNTADLIRVEVRVQLEIWFPNLGSTPDGRFRVSESPAIEPASIILSPQETLDKWEFDAPSPFTLLSMTFVHENATLLTPGQTLDIKIPLHNLKIERMADQAILDRFASNLVILFENMRIPLDGETASETRIFEALDPKLNHRLDMWISQTADTLGAVNASARNFIQANPGRGPLYTVLGPATQLSDVESLGFFPLDEPWATVNLFGEDGRWFLRHLREPNWSPGWSRDKINPNSSYAQVLEALFQSVRIERFPGDPAALPLSEEQSWTLAEFLEQEVGQGRGFVQRGDWTKALEGMDFQSEFGWDRFQAESLVRQLNRVFETSQQYWGLVLMAEWRSPAGAARGRAKVAALIRRDPFTDIHQKHSWAPQLWIPLP